MIDNSPSVEACLPEAARVTNLMESAPAFSLLRLGDGELSCMLAVKNGKAPPRYRYDEKAAASIETTYSVSGIEPRHFPRLFEAFEHCTYLDYCNSIPYIERHLNEAGINRDPALYRNPSPLASNIILAWTSHELPKYLKTHRTLFASAESALLRELCKDSAYHEASGGFWPPGAHVSFHQIRNNGRFFSENLDLIKDDLRAEIERTGCDTLFLSLATGAKILCYELATEMCIRAIDFGSMTRALAYAGTPGYHGGGAFTTRSCSACHSRSSCRPWSVRTPRSMCQPSSARLTASSHWRSRNSSRSRFDEPDVLTQSCGFGAKAGPRFQAGTEVLQSLTIGVRALNDSEAAKLHRDFVRWRRKMGIGWDAKIFVQLVKVKGLLRRIWGPKQCPSQDPSGRCRDFCGLQNPEVSS